MERRAMATARKDGKMETTAKERDGDDGTARAAEAVIPITGRAVPLTMGSVRLGGAGRPVAIDASRASHVEAGDHGERQRPRVVLEPHPRSPFGRKLETNVSFSLAAEQQTHARPRFQVQKATAAPSERVHATHHSTQRTPLATAVRQAEATPSTAAQASRTTSTVVHHATSMAVAKKRSVRDEEKVALTRRPKTASEEQIQDTSEAVKRAKHNVTSQRATANLRPEDMAAFVRKPLSGRDQDRGATRRVGFHEHERLFETIIEDSTSNDDQTKEPLSGWRAVDESIDFIYEDPSIDVVQLQLMLHGNRVGGIKRKAVERERLQLAAAEVHKHQQKLASKMDELQRRKENISKLSEDIRSRNKPASKKTSAPTVKKKKTVEQTPPHLTRKPPVPRLSQLGTKPVTVKKAKKNAQTKADDLPTDRGVNPADENTADDASDNEGTAEDHQDASASGSILLGISSGPRDKPTSSKVPKKRKTSKPRSANETSQLREKLSSEPPEEQVQRRAVAREYMQLQKQARQLLKAKVEGERRYEEERRKMELQRLEQVRLRELEETRKRRIKQKQRDRISRRKLEQQKLDNAAHAHNLDPSLASPSKSDDVSASNNPDIENQSFRDNDPSRKKRRNGEFEWPGSDHDSSSPSSPNQLPNADGVEDDTFPSTDPKLLKLLQLEEKAKLLTSRLQSLSNRTKSKVTDQGDITSDTVLDGEERLDRVFSASDGEEHESVDEEDVDDHGSETRILEESDEESDDDIDEDEDEDGDDNEEYVEADHGNRYFSTRKIDHERFACFERELHRQTVDEDDEFDLASIGVHKIQVVWPREHASDSASDEDPQPSSRFEELSSSSSSSSSPPSHYALKHHERRNQRETWRSEDSDDGELHSPKLVEDSVGSYAQRLLETARIQHAAADDIEGFADRTQTTTLHSGSAILKTSHWLGDELSPRLRGKRAQPSSDAELLRLIRESDDNLSVIDREAKRRFRIQQERARQRREEQERFQAEKVKAMLTANVSRRPPDSPKHAMEETIAESATSDRHAVGEREHGGSSHIIKLEDILQAVKDDSAIAKTHFRTATHETHVPDGEEDEHRSAPPPVVEFWNQQLRSGNEAPLSGQDRAASRHRPARVEIDRTDLHTQRQRQFEAEDEDDADENEHRRIVSPHTLAKQLLAAVEYHEAINDAHLQLSMMEKAHALEQVQQDTIALAQAFKEEMDSTLLAQQLVDEHTALENKFDDDLHQVVGQLEIVRQAEREDHERQLERAKDEARADRQRETSVQTEPPRLADAMTSARLQVEVGVATESERVEFGVQCVETRVPEDTKINRSEDFAIPSPSSPLASQSPTDEYTEDYGEEIFDAASTSSPGKVTRMDRELSIEDDLKCDDELATANEIESAESVASDVESEKRARAESEEGEDKSEIASASAESNYDDDANDKQSVSSVGEEDEIGSEAESMTRAAEMSASIRYDDDDFEDQTSLVLSDSRPAKSTSDVIENDKEEVDDGEGEIDEEEEHTEVSMVSSDHDDIKSEKYSSQSYDDDLEKSAAPGKVGTVTAVPPLISPSVQLRPPLAPIALVQPSQLPSISLTTDVGQAYVAQLENRRQSEQALLAIRLQALHNKLQQDTQPLVEAIKVEEQKPAKLRNSETVRQFTTRREALQIAFLSEQANLESQRSACVSRYYQDLLAFQSMGLTTDVLSALQPTGQFFATVDQHRNIGELVSHDRPTAAMAPSKITRHVDNEGSSNGNYSEDEFTSTADDAEKSTKHDDGTSAEVSEVADDQSAKSVSQDSEEEEDFQSVVDEHSGDVDEVSNAEQQSVISEPDDQDYGDDDFASVSESTKTVEKIGDSSGISVESRPSIEDEPHRAQSGDVEVSMGDGEIDDAEEEDDFEPVNDTTAEHHDDASVSAEAQTDAALPGGSAEVEIGDDYADSHGEQDPSEGPASEAAYSEDNFETSAVPAPEEYSASVMLTSQSDDSSTTKLLVAEVEEVHNRLKIGEDLVNSKLETKVEKKRLKAQELIEAKGNLIKQQVERFRREEERVQVDTIAEIALGLDVKAEVEKGKDFVKEKLTSEFEALKQTYQELVPQRVVHRGATAKEGSTSPPVEVPKVTAPTLSKKAEIPQDNSGGQYSEDYDEYEVESFENDGSIASEVTADVSTRRSLEFGEDGAEEEDHKVGDTANDDVSENNSIADESAEMVEASGDELDDYGDEEFDEAAASSQGGDIDTSGEIDEIGENHPTKPTSPTGHDAQAEQASADDEDDQYDDEDFEQSISRQSSMASGFREALVDPVVHTSQVVNGEEAESIDASSTQDRAETSDIALRKMESELQETRAQTEEAATTTANFRLMEPVATANVAADATPMPTLLSESLSINYAEDDLVTASMDEQTKRTEDLRRKIEARKQEFAAVQKQLKIEKKKEHLRVAETQLWTEMEQLESQLVADERILALTRQRGRLESIQLEAKYSDLYYQAAGSRDLLEGFDFVEDVEAVKSPVIKQDHQAQVRLTSVVASKTETRTADSTAATQRDAETQVDFLLAYDYVEVAERPMFSTATTTDILKETMTTLVVEKITSTSDHHFSTTTECSIATPGERQYEKTDLMLDNASLLGDLLAVYDFVEIAELVVAAEVDPPDLLEGFDHVEPAEEFELLVPDSAAASEELSGIDAVTNEIDDVEVDESVQSLDESVGENANEVQSDDAQFEEQQGGLGDESVPDEQAAEEMGQHELQEEDVKDGLASDAEVGTPSATVGGHAGEPPLGVALDQEDSTVEEADKELVTRVTESMLARLLQDAIADMSVFARRAAADAKVSAEVLERIVAEESARAIASGDHLSDESSKNGDVEHVEDQEVAVEEEDGDGPHRIYDDEIASERIADRLFDQFTSSAVVEGVRLCLKQKSAAPLAQVLPVAAVAVQQDDATLKTQATDQDLGDYIANQLRWAADGISLPRLGECIGSRRDAQNASAIYDAVLEIAVSVHRSLAQDLAYQALPTADMMLRKLVEKVQREMEESVWKRQEAASQALDRIAHKAQEDEQGELDKTDLRLLRAQQRIGSDALCAHFQATATHNHLLSSKPAAVRRRLGSTVPSSGISSQILQQEEDRLADGITERLMRELLAEELRWQPANQRQRR